MVNELTLKGFKNIWEFRCRMILVILVTAVLVLWQLFLSRILPVIPFAFGIGVIYHFAVREIRLYRTAETWELQSPPVQERIVRIGHAFITFPGMRRLYHFYCLLHSRRKKS